MTNIIPVGQSSLCSEENCAWPADDSLTKNQTNRYRKAKLKRSDIESYTLDRINWIREGCPGSFHDYR